MTPAPLSRLLPPNRTALDIALADTLQTDLQTHGIRRNWDAQTCPENLLPWLAWTVHVDAWDDAWPVSIKRGMIAASIDIHRHKGTRYAVDKMLDVLGLGDSAEVVEWHQASPLPGTRTAGTFDVLVLPKNAPNLKAALPALASVKPVSAQLRPVMVDTVPLTAGPRAVGLPQIVDYRPVVLRGAARTSKTVRGIVAAGQVMERVACRTLQLPPHAPMWLAANHRRTPSAHPDFKVVTNPLPPVGAIVSPGRAALPVSLPAPARPVALGQLRDAHTLRGASNLAATLRDSVSVSGTLNQTHTQNNLGLPPRHAGLLSAPRRLTFSPLAPFGLFWRVPESDDMLPAGKAGGIAKAKRKLAAGVVPQLRVPLQPFAVNAAQLVPAALGHFSQNRPAPVHATPALAILTAPHAILLPPIVARAALGLAKVSIGMATVRDCRISTQSDSADCTRQIARAGVFAQNRPPLPRPPTGFVPMLTAPAGTRPRSVAVQVQPITRHAGLFAQLTLTSPPPVAAHTPRTLTARVLGLVRVPTHTTHTLPTLHAVSPALQAGLLSRNYRSRFTPVSPFGVFWRLPEGETLPAGSAGGLARLKPAARVSSLTRATQTAPAPVASRVTLGAHAGVVLQNRGLSKRLSAAVGFAHFTRPPAVPTPRLTAHATLRPAVAAAGLAQSRLRQPQDGQALSVSLAGVGVGSFAANYRTDLTQLFGDADWLAWLLGAYAYGRNLPVDPTVPPGAYLAGWQAAAL